mgnify:CR=1 FL=1
MREVFGGRKAEKYRSYTFFAINVPAVTRLGGGREQIGARVGVDGVRAPLRKGCGVEVREVGVGAR